MKYVFKKENIKQVDTNIVKSDCGKRIKRIGEEQSYSEITEANDKPREYEEVE